MKKLFVLLLLSGSLHLYSQNWPLKKMITDKKESGEQFMILPVFSFVASKSLADRGIYQQLQLDTSFLDKVMEQRPAALQLSITLESGNSFTCDLVKYSPGNIKLTENNDGVLEHLKIPVTYRGIVAGEQNKNTVTLTVNDDYLSLVASFPDKTIQVAKAGKDSKAIYRLYNSTQIQFPLLPFDCGTNEQAPAQTSLGIDLTGGSTPTAVQDKCVNVMVDCSDSMFLWRSSNRQQVINYVYELFNPVITGYFNDTINVQITTINIWTTASPYRAATRETALAQMAAYWQDNFFGNLCVGLDFSIRLPAGLGRGGVAGDIGRIKAVSTNTCPAYTGSKSACCYNDLNYNLNLANFPTGPNTTQSQVYSVMHEMGHLLGAHHTKWCGWKISTNPDVFGTIDSCGVIEGNCMQGPPPPANGATIMSYCVTSMLNGNFVNYQNGFGRLPGNAVRNFVEQSACILTCVDCFGLRSNNNKDGYAFQNNKEGIKKEKPAGEGSSNEPLKQQPSAGNLFINSKK